jgi:hypothetical protein
MVCLFLDAPFLTRNPGWLLHAGFVFYLTNSIYPPLLTLPFSLSAPVLCWRAFILELPKL